MFVSAFRGRRSCLATCLSHSEQLNIMPASRFFLFISERVKLEIYFKRLKQTEPESKRKERDREKEGAHPREESVSNRSNFCHLNAHHDLFRNPLSSEHWCFFFRWHLHMCTWTYEYHFFHLPHSKPVFFPFFMYTKVRLQKSRHTAAKFAMPLGSY